MIFIQNTLEKFRFSPSQIIVLGFVALILIGTFLLNLPIASRDGQSIGLMNALFTSTSAVCVTGLVVVDTAQHWSVFGQVVILSLIQIGGLGFMTIATLLSLIIGRKIGLRERILIQESLNQNSLQGLVKFTRQIIIITLIVQLLGSLLLAIEFIPRFGLGKGMYFSIFHSISAFNNAGFDLMGQYSGEFSSLTAFVTSPIVNMVIGALIILGGLGFHVYKDLLHSRSIRKLSLHSKVVLSTSLFLIVFGALFFLAVEYSNPKTIGSMPLGEKITTSVFHSISPRTAGFNTLSLPDMTNASKFLTIILMFIGGSPGSTAGGIKTVTIGVLILAVISTIKGKEDVEVFKRRLQTSVINKSLAIAVISMTVVTGLTLLISLFEKTDFINIMFEVTSAFATVGLSLGITPELSTSSKMLIAATMLFGRVGPLSIALALSARAGKYKTLISYPEDRVMVG